MDYELVLHRTYKLATPSQERELHVDTSGWLITFVPSRFHELYQYALAVGLRLEKIDLNKGIVIAETFRSDKKSPLPGMSSEFPLFPRLIDSDGNSVYVRPSEIIVHLTSEHFGRSLSSLEAIGKTSVLTEHVVLQTSSYVWSPFALAERVQAECTSEGIRYWEPIFVDFPMAEAPFEYKGLMNGSFGSLTYTRKTTKETVVFEPVPNRFTVTYVPNPAEDSADSLRSQGLNVIDMDSAANVAIVEIPDPAPPGGTTHVFAAYFARLSRLLSAPSDSQSPITGLFPITREQNTNLITAFQPLQILVRFAPNVLPELMRSVLNQLPAAQLGQLDHSCFLLITADPAKVFYTVNSLNSMNEVMFAEPVFLTFHPEDAGDSPVSYNPQQWNLEEVKAQEAWTIEQGRSDVVIVVIDVGVDLTSTALAQNILEQGNEQWNFVPGGSSSPQEFVQAHGTSVSGILCGRYNGRLIAGVAPGCRILPIKAWKDAITSADLVNVLTYIRNFAGRRPELTFVVNMSFGISFSETIGDVISKCFGEGMIFVASAGNNAQFNVPHYPSDFANVISVAATQRGGIFASQFSNYGNKIAVAAPGGANYNSADQENVLILKPRDLLEYSSGTSYAAPHVAAAVALILSRAKRLGKPITPEQVRGILTGSARRIDDINPAVAGFLGAGLIDVARALEAVNAL